MGKLRHKGVKSGLEVAEAVLKPGQLDSRLLLTSVHCCLPRRNALKIDIFKGKKMS